MTDEQADRLIAVLERIADQMETTAPRARLAAAPVDSPNLAAGGRPFRGPQFERMQAVANAQVAAFATGMVDLLKDTTLTTSKRWTSLADQFDPTTPDPTQP